MSNQGASGKRSVLGLLAAGAIGLALGLIAAWIIWPVRWVDTDPADLRPAHQAAYMQMVADSYAINGDIGLARERLLQLTRGDAGLAAVAALAENVATESQSAGDGASAARLRRMSDDTGLSTFAPEPGAPAVSTTRPPLPNWVMIIFGAGVVIIALAAVVGLILARANRKAAQEPEFPVFDAGLAPLAESPESFGAPRMPAAPARRPSLEEILGVSQASAPQPVDDEQEAEEWLPGEQGVSALDEEEAFAPFAGGASASDEFEAEIEETLPIAPAPTVATAPPAAAPEASARQPQAPASLLSEFQVRYHYGDDDFYHSVTIDTLEESFVGQCGIVISDVLGSGDAQQVDAFDLWLFETHGTRTVSKVLLSPWAARDDGIVARLSRKGEPVVARPGLTITLQTMTLRLTAQIIELSFQNNPPQPEAVFGHLVLQVQVEQLAL